MAYLALYRAFRPETLDKVVRQEHIVKILRNQIEQDRIGHAYLFCGPRGTGKTSIAKIFARAVNCQHPVNGSPCGECAACKALNGGNGLDVVEIDAASNNGVDEMRDLREKVQYPPVNGRYKVYIIDEVHMLSAGAFNALLKTLEEPPKHAVFILATTESQKIPATILSRCMRFDFKLIPQEDLEAHLKNVLNKIGKEYEEEAISAIARAGAGSVRDMLSIADICVSYSQGKLTYEGVNAVLGSADFSRMSELCGAMLKEDVAAALSLTEKILSEGKGVGVLVRDVLQFLNNCSIVKTCRDAKNILSLPEEMYQKIKNVADGVNGYRLLRISEIFAEAESKLRYSTSPRILLETSVMKAAMPETDASVSSLIARVCALEEKINSGNFTPSTTVLVKAEEVKTAPVEEKEREEELPPLPEEPIFEEPFYVEEKPPVQAVKPAIKQVEPIIAPTENTTNSVALDKAKAFGLFLRAIRKSCRNGVLITMCSELDSRFEGEKLVLLTDSETMLNALLREEHKAIITTAMSSVGVTDYEIRLARSKSEEDRSAIEQIKRDFSNTPVQIN